MRYLFVSLIAILIAGSAAAQSAVTATQGPGSTASSEWKVNTAARFGGQSSEVLVLAVATTIPRLAGAKSIEIQNLGPDPIFCTVDGQAPLTTGALGRKILGAPSEPQNVWALDVGPGVVIKCITTVPQVTTAATQVTQIR